MPELRLVFTAFPGPKFGFLNKDYRNICIFMDAEDAYGRRVNCGEWRKREDGWIELVITTLPNPDVPEPPDDDPDA